MDGQEDAANYHPSNRNSTGRKMTKMIICIRLAAAFGLSLAGAQAMPFAPIGTEPATLAIPVADGCGFNRYRDARGICRKKYVITRHQGRQPVYTGCGGVNSHRVCNLYGHCWMVCD
jgi:hypothetical protein